VADLTGRRTRAVVISRADLEHLLGSDQPSPAEAAALLAPAADMLADAGVLVPGPDGHLIHNEDVALATAIAAEEAKAAAQLEADPPRPRLGEILIEHGSIDATQLRHALHVQRRTGERLGRILTHYGLAASGAVARALAQLYGLDHLEELPPVSLDAVELVPEAVCRRHRMLPVTIQDHVLVVAMVDPGDQAARAALRRFTRLPVKEVVVTDRLLVATMREQHRDSQTELSVYGLLNRSPTESAHVVLYGYQKPALIAIVLALLVAIVLAPITTFTVLGICSMSFYSAFSIFKIWSVIASLGHEPMLTISSEEAASISEADLPIYTVLVPLYKETEVLPRLVKGLAELDYPTGKLDVKLLLEEDDVETVKAAQEMDLPAFIDIVVTPDSQPKTKPKSCNYGLLYARGEFTVIFDAEDIPEKDQLRKAVVAFRKAPPNIVCLQGQLNYYNRGQNLLTAWFTGEYSAWFDMFVPGLDNLNMPIPLGGTSNHFVTDVLVTLGAWDPFNVTEDADLGIRLFHAGYKTATLNSTTYEEANSETFNWIRQRSRWVKGYIQTWLVHMRRPGHLIHGVGLRNFIGFQLVIAGTFFVFLLNPFQWAILLLWTLSQANVVRQLFPGALYYIAWASFLLGNFAFCYINLLAVLRRRYWDLMGAALLGPLYWGLMSIAAWRGLLQLIWAPSYWEKTEHGLDGGAHDAAIGTINAAGSGGPR
jgi:cellulose synthase/poly-beta-1,6-N-acetylglucosamine synthase-like glycosyltransferase